MHQPIKDGLEDYLAGKTGTSREFTQHLQSCPDCEAELNSISSQARLFGALRANVEPRAGFYARVLEKIEQQTPPSIWAIMLEPRFGRRIAVACATATLVLVGYLIGTEPGDRSAQTRPALVQMSDGGHETAATASQDRDAVLLTLASFREN